MLAFFEYNRLFYWHLQKPFGVEAAHKIRQSPKKWNTVAPRYNEPRYNKDPIIMNIWKPGRITVTYGETNPAITNPAIKKFLLYWFWRSQCTIYPTMTNILSCRLQLAKTTWWYKWVISQIRLLLVKIGKLDLQSFALFRCSCSRASL